MKEIKIKYNNKEIVVTKDILTTLIGILILIADTLLTGLIQLIELGFNFEYLQSSEFWTSYIIKLIISYTALFGAYIIRKVYNKKTPKFIIQRERIKDNKNIIIKERKIANCKNWLKYIYNYKKKVEIYQNKILTAYEKIILNEPDKPDMDYLNKNNFFDKIKIKHLNKLYNKKLSKWHKNDEMRKYYEQQLNICEKHFEIIENYKNHNIEKVKQLQEEIKNIDHFKNCKFKYRNITYNKLFNVDLDKNTNIESIEYNESNILALKIIPTILSGLIVIALITSIIPKYKGFTPESLLMILINILLMIWYILSGIKVADNFIYNIVYIADTNRLTICEEFLEDSNINGDNWTYDLENNEE